MKTAAGIFVLLAIVGCLVCYELGDFWGADKKEKQILNLADKQDGVYRELRRRYPDGEVFISYLMNSKNDPIINVEVLLPPRYKISYHCDVIPIGRGEFQLGKCEMTYAEISRVDFATRGMHYGDHKGVFSESEKQAFANGGDFSLPPVIEDGNMSDYETIKRYWNSVEYPKQ